MVYILLKRKPLPPRASTPDVKQTLKPDLLEGENSFGLGFLPPRVWRRLDEARRVTPGERQRKGIEKSICVCTFVIAILHGSLCDGFVSSAVTGFQRCFFCNLYKESFGDCLLEVGVLVSLPSQHTRRCSDLLSVRSLCSRLLFPSQHTRRKDDSDLLILLSQVLQFLNHLPSVVEASILNSRSICLQFLKQI